MCFPTTFLLKEYLSKMSQLFVIGLVGAAEQPCEYGGHHLSKWFGARNPLRFTGLK